MKPLETSFERIETKYMVSKTDLQDLNRRFERLPHRGRLSDFDHFQYLL